MSDARIFEIRDRVRWSDVDMAGIIYFGAYVRFAEIAETELFRELGFTYTDVFDRYDFSLPRVHFEMDFFKPAKLDDELTVRTHVAGVGVSSIRMKMEIVRSVDSIPLAEAQLTVVSVDRTTMTSKPTPEPIALALRGCLATP